MITIYSKDYCPFCIKAKELISSLWFEYNEIDVTETPEVVIEVSQISGFRTVPQIFVWEITKQNCLGWFSDIKKLHDEGKLIDILNTKN